MLHPRNPLEVYGVIKLAQEATRKGQQYGMKRFATTGYGSHKHPVPPADESTFACFQVLVRAGFADFEFAGVDVDQHMVAEPVQGCPAVAETVTDKCGCGLYRFQ